LGIGDQNIKTIQETVKTQIVVRGSAMHLDGDKEDVKLIEMIVKEMMFTINNKGFVLPEDIRGYLASLKNGESSTMNGNGEEPVVLYTHKGSVNARTNGQKK
jgi:phosphate starvation-inducible PhoH-like protein